MIFSDPARRKRAELLRHIQHALAALLLILAGYDGLASAAHRSLILSVLQIIIGSILIAIVILEKLRRHEGNGAFPLIDTGAAAMLVVEGLNRALHGSHIIQYLYYLTGILTFVMGFYFPRISFRRHFRLDNISLYYRKNPFKTFQIEWKKIKSISYNGFDILIADNIDRKFDINLKKTYDNDDICRRLFEFASTRGLDADQLIIEKTPHLDHAEAADDLLPSSQ
ncbi:membrane hypothetical protein [Candidatus Zixiibacteriota bacterium]|nr:membrane hypothetical protein [candidate division Zixibacteria bacterium]